MRRFIRRALAAVGLIAVCYMGQGVYISEVLYGVGCCRTGAGAQPAAAGVQGPPYTIIIDPGHGGMDTGAESIAIETDVINKTTGYLYELLKQDENFTPLLTRREDEDPDSGRRADIANSQKADLLISIHANSDSSRSSSGFECYPTTPGRPYHEQAMTFARLVTKHMRLAGHKLRGSSGEAGIKFAFYSGNSKKIVDSSDTKVRSLPSFGILEKSDCPALLVEQCFVTNYSDVQNWAKDEGCKKAAGVYYRAIKEYFEIS